MSVPSDPSTGDYALARDILRLETGELVNLAARKIAAYWAKRRIAAKKTKPRKRKRIAR